MTNDLFRDLLDNKIPGHETPKTVTISITPEWHRPILFSSDTVSIAIARLRVAMEAHYARRPWTDYGAHRGLEGIERAHFNEAVEKLASNTPWTRGECAEVLGKIMDAAQHVELEKLQRERHPNSRCAPTDPRARALWAKQSRGTGPNATPLRVRGRTTHYKEKH